MEKHVQIVAALQIGLSIFNLLIVFILYAVFGVIGGFIDNYQAEMAISIIVNIIGTIIVMISIPGIIAGIGLYKRKEWARILTIVISAFEVLSFPIGTAIGIYSIWTLVQPETIAGFKN